MEDCNEIEDGQVLFIYFFSSFGQKQEQNVYKIKKKVKIKYEELKYDPQIKMIKNEIRKKKKKNITSLLN